MGLWSVPIQMTMSSTYNLAVILLDEADSFIEQRRAFDLQRNAVVSG
jgi:hypothetical protein